MRELIRRPCPTLIVLGSGMEGKDKPTQATRQRAIAAARYYQRNMSTVELIICSGGYSALFGPPEDGAMEGDWMAEFVQRAVVEAPQPDASRGSVNGESVRVLSENTSTTTIENIMHTVQAGYLDDVAIDHEHPVGLVTDPWAHYLRARQAARVGLQTDAIRCIPSHNEGENIRARTLRLGMELGGVALTAWALHGTEDNLDPAERLMQAQQRLEHATGRLHLRRATATGAAT